MFFKMNIAVIVLSLLAVSTRAALKAADKCSSDVCSISNNCRCSSTISPLTEGEAPQLISLTFDEGVVENIYLDVWEPLLFNRTNPDGNPIGATFFVPHEYTNYKRVQDLYLRGFEIGVNSITKNSSSEYWSKGAEETLENEFQGQRTIISTFANIPIEDIVGARTPQLQLQGDVSIEAYVAAGIQYDSSWTSRSNAMYFPYTLDYLSTQECRTGTTCPSESHPGFWILPIINLQGNGTIECNSLTACNIQGTADEISSWLLEQVERERNSTKAPLTLMVPSSWFRFTENSYDGFVKFLDALGNLDDVFLVTQKQVIDWIKNPVPLGGFQTEVPERTADCGGGTNCALQDCDGNLKYMFSCVACPEKYPWLGNPTGDSSVDC